MKKDAEIIGVWGTRGCGKTTRMIEMLRNRDRVIILDPIGSFKAKGFKTVNKLPDVYKAIKAGWSTGFKIIFRTPSTEEDCIATIGALSRGLFQVQKLYYNGKDKRTITLGLDEAHKYFPNRRMEPAIQQPLEDLIALGRHYGIEMIAASQRLAKVWTEYRGNCSQHYFFMQGDHTDFSAVLSIIGTQHKDALRGLKVHEYLHKGQGMDISKGKNTAKF